MTRPLVLAAAAVFGMAGMAGTASAQLPMEIEGPIDSIVVNSDGSGTITVMGVPILIPNSIPAVPISSPTASMDIATLAITTSLPNRQDHQGFEGGTAIVIGTTDGVNSTAEDVFVEPAENVVLGVLTQVPGDSCDQANIQAGDFKLNGIELNFLTDLRIPFAGASDANGFPIADLCSIELGAAAVEGYYAGGQLNIFLMEATAAAPVGNFTSIERARCRTGRDIEVRGATTAETGTVTVTNEASGALIGQAAIAPDGLGGGTYRLRVGVVACPTEVRSTSDDGSFAIAGVEIR